MLNTILLVRHGESAANVDKSVLRSVPDYKIPLTPRGIEQARRTGQVLGRQLLLGEDPGSPDPALIYCSPYVRGQQTLEHLLAAAVPDPAGRDSLRAYCDPRLRELDHGYADVAEQERLRAHVGWFWYRFTGGESPADTYDRISNFIESMMRQAERRQTRRALVVTHGLTLRCFVMRFLHLSPEQFDQMANPGNCDVVALAQLDQRPAPVWDKPAFRTGRWGVWGIRLREPARDAETPEPEPAYRHPMQPLYLDVHGVVRFRPNKIVRALLEQGRFDMNEVARMSPDPVDHMQLAQIIGYSVSGFGDLSYADPAVVAQADRLAAALLEKKR